MENQPVQQENFNQPAASAKKPFKFGLSIAIVIICFVATSVTVYWIKTEPEEQSMTSVNITKSDNATANWQTYRNEEYNYEIKFPSYLYIYKDNPADIFIQPEKEIADSIPGPHASALEISIIDLKGEIMFEQAIIDALPSGVNNDLELIRINGIDGYKVKTICEGVGCGSPEWFFRKADRLYHFDSNLGYKPIFDQIVSSFTFTNLNYCSDPPEPTAIGRDIYPMNIGKYGDIGFLGELFTADDCGAERVKNIFGVDRQNYKLESDIALKNAPSQPFLEILQEVGFTPGDTCQGKIDTSSCTHWTLLKTVPLKEIMKLKPYADQIKSSGCINCG